MKLIWHIVKKDIARERWALAVWALLFVAQDLLGVYARLDLGQEGDWVTGLQLANAGLVFLQLVMAYVLVARWVHADPLIGSDLFWAARPISGGRLWAAKAAGVLLLFALVPVLLLLPWWLYCRFGPHDILWTAVDTVGWQLLVIGPAFLVASLTDDLGRVLLWTLLLVNGLLSWIALLQVSLVSEWSRAMGRVGSAMLFTRIWLCAVVLVAGGFLVAAHQFLTRRFGGSVILTVICLGLVALVGQAWPWNFAEVIGGWSRPAVSTVNGDLASKVDFTSFAAKGALAKSPGRDATLYVSMRVLGLPDDFAVSAESRPMTWTWADGLKLSRDAGYGAYANSPGDGVLRRLYSLPPHQEDEETKQWFKARKEERDARWKHHGEPTVQSWPPPGLWLSANTAVPNSFLAKMRSDPPRWESNLHVVLYRGEVTAALPLVPGARAVGDGRTFELAQWSDEKATVKMTRPTISISGLWSSDMISGNYRAWLFRERFVAVNRVTGDTPGLRDTQVGSRILLVGGVTINWNVVLLIHRKVIRSGQWVEADPEWPQHTTLAYLVDREIARFERKVATDKFEVNEP
ncbi:MAG TPA: hypothetical protein VG936_02830 [Lacunisphaera sp.]|nr:hypothetical protein [Lacunisphaera sp.]